VLYLSHKIKLSFIDEVNHVKNIII
ncbi:MAG: hypothetical protein RL017_730, partial [Pseudomonadota bacterium]